MTRPAEQITIEFEDDEVWAPSVPDKFWGPDHGTWTPESVQKWFADTAPARTGLGKLLGSPAPTMISTALGPCAMRYAVRGGLLFPKWAVMSRMDEEALGLRQLPEGCHIEHAERALYLHFEDAEPFTLSEPLGLVHCSRSHDGLHWYIEGERRFSREPELYLQPTEGADGHL